MPPSPRDFEGILTFLRAAIQLTSNVPTPGHFACRRGNRLLLLAKSKHRILARPRVLVLQPRLVAVLGATIIIGGVRLLVYQKSFSRDESEETISHGYT